MMRGHYLIFNAIDAGANLWGGLPYNSGSQVSYAPMYQVGYQIFNTIQMVAISGVVYRIIRAPS